MKQYSRKKSPPRENGEREHFNSLAEGYDYKYHYSEPFTQYKLDKKSKEFANIVTKHVNENRPKILEIGCGTGEYTKRIAKLLPQASITGLDISKNIVKVAKRKCKKVNNTSFVVRGAYKTTYPQSSFDVVCGFYVLHHLDINKTKKEILRILKPGGVLFFYEPNILNPVVYLIKSNKTLKRMVGDSPDEWAINPITIKNMFGKRFRAISIVQTEFIWPLFFLPISLLIMVDKMFTIVRYIPIVNYFGGSVQICLVKKK